MNVLREKVAVLLNKRYGIMKIQLNCNELLSARAKSD